LEESWLHSRRSASSDVGKSSKQILKKSICDFDLNLSRLINLTRIDILDVVLFDRYNSKQMPKSRARSGSIKNIAASSSSTPLLALNQIPNHDTNNSKLLTSSRECDNNGRSEPSLHSIEIRNQINKTDISQLSSVVTDLIMGRRDQSAYQDFLLILEHFSVRSLRDDHLEETFYHLIQAAVTFIRANQQRFDKNKLEECYRHRHDLKINSIQ
jgi:hypothetical protein